MQNQEQTFQTKQCKSCSATFHITNKDMEFYDKVSPIFGGEKHQIPSPTLCPDCRQQRRLTRRNERKLYRRKCDATGKPIISIYSQEKSYKVYSQDFRRSDNRDPMQYGRDFDFNSGFFEQFDELMKEVPRQSIQLKNCENCNYSNIAVNAKNCYLSNTCSWSEEVHYSGRVVHSKYCVDCYRSTNIENCYKSILCSNSNGLDSCIEVKNSSNCKFSYQLDGCSNCFLCTNLVNKNYFIQNKEYSKEEYIKKQMILCKNIQIIKYLKSLRRGRNTHLS